MDEILDLTHDPCCFFLFTNDLLVYLVPFTAYFTRHLSAYPGTWYGRLSELGVQ